MNNVAIDENKQALSDCNNTCVAKRNDSNINNELCNFPLEINIIMPYVTITGNRSLTTNNCSNFNDILFNEMTETIT